MSEAAVSEAKSQLRLQCRKTRSLLGEATRARASQSICVSLEQWPIFQQSASVLTYMPIKGEVDFIPLLDRHPEKCWILPRILPEGDYRMVFHVYDPNRLVQHPFGMAEPTPDLPLVPANEIQLALVPGLAFDRRGWRLGYGGGYYDRFLTGVSGISAGITFQPLLLDGLPHNEFDVPMKWIVTEEEFFEIDSLEGKS